MNTDATADRQDWQDPQVVARNKQPGHATLTPYADEASALPDDWAARRVFLLFEGVESAFYLYVNGREVGYSQGSRLPAEFEITDALRPGANTLAATVLRW